MYKTSVKKITKKVGNKILVINVPCFDGGEFIEQFLEMIWLAGEDDFIRLTEDGFERILE
jgi:hypothetical protein